MRDHGYKPEFAAALTIASSVVGRSSRRLSVDRVRACQTRLSPALSRRHDPEFSWALV